MGFVTPSNDVENKRVACYLFPDRKRNLKGQLVIPEVVSGGSPGSASGKSVRGKWPLGKLARYGRHGRKLFGVVFVAMTASAAFVSFVSITANATVTTTMSSSSTRPLLSRLEVWL